MEGGVTPYSSSMTPSGSYILIVVSQPLTEEHKYVILDKLNKGLLSWDVSLTGCDLSGLENAFSAIIKERVIEGDVLIQHSTESLGVEVLLSPTVRTLKQCFKNLLSTPTSHKQIIHAGYAFAGSGSWIVENGTFSFAEFQEIFEQADVQKRCTINVHCAEEGGWNKTNFAKDIFTKSADISLNPLEKVKHVPGAEHLVTCLDNVLITQSMEEIMKPSPLVGNIRFNRPTIYMFPAGQGDCALFGINGFNMLIDGGFHRKPCSWEFVRHLDRLDAVLVTRIGESNVCGVSTLMKRNALNNANPQIGYVFCNIAENKPNPKDLKLEKKDDLIISVVGEGHQFVQTLSDLKLKPHQCWRDSSIDPFVLYHKVGQGTLEMHILSPPRDSKEMKIFLTEWNAYKETFSGVKSELRDVENTIPLSHATSICAILVWRPEDPKDTITRILFPGSAPQNKILEGLDKLKSLNILNHPVVTKATLANMPSKMIKTKVEKSVSRASIPNRKNTASPALSASSIASKNGDIGGLKKEVKKVVKEVKKEVKKDILKDVKKEVKTENTGKKDTLIKKESVKDTKKDTKEIKKVVKKEIKPIVDKKQEVKSTIKKDSTTPNGKPMADIKKATTAKKSTTPVKKDAGKPPIVPKTDAKKTVSKASDVKVSKDVKKVVETKTATKIKPKVSSSAPKASTTAKTKPVAVPKPGSKMTKAVAASSIVASAVAVTAAAVELNEKKEIIDDIEPEIPEKETENNVEVQDGDVNEKSVEDVVSPLPPEALSPTPSESMSLTPSDTLSSAPLETVSPTPPLPNEPMSTEEKDVNEIKDIEQDMPYEQETHEEVETPNLEKAELEIEREANDIEVELAKHQTSSDVMSASFIGGQQTDDAEAVEHITATESNLNESVIIERDDYEIERAVSEKDIEVEESIVEKDTVEDMKEQRFVEKDVEEDIIEKTIVEGVENELIIANDIEEDIVKKETVESIEEQLIEKDVDEDKEIAEVKNSMGEKYIEGKYDISEEEAIKEKDIGEVVKYSVKEEDSVEEKDIAEVVNDAVKEKETVEEKDIAEEKDSVEEEDTVEDKYVAKEKESDDEKDIAEEKYNVEKDIAEEKDVMEEKDMDEDKEVVKHFEQANDTDEDKNIIDDYEDKYSYGKNAKENDNQLAGLTMEGSFCAGMSSTDENIISTTENEYIQSDGNDYPASELMTKDEKFLEENTVDEEIIEKKNVYETETNFRSETSESSFTEHEKMHVTQEVNEDYTTVHEDQKLTEQYEAKQQEYQNLPSHYAREDNDDQDDRPICGRSGDADHGQAILNPNMSEINEVQEHIENEYNESHFDKLSNIQSMDESFHQDAYDSYEHSPNINDPEMQETSVDGPEEIARKESVVSITLNDENLEEHYTENWRRKSGTESEDDVDIGKYMSKEQTVDEEKLHIQRDTDSDEEDVVKSPTPHAVVDYDGQLDEVINVSNEKGGDVTENTLKDKDIHLTEKQDFDEKDRDSAEEQDIDDGEMIRHPTPPEMKYSEEEMRDPIGQHFITNLGLKSQGTDITEQPLYEEAEDSASERSSSPIVEQPVFGSTVQADFPELVTVSGGTTPSEPQSPKSSFEAKKFATESSVMDALSEHDISESSTHSPSCQDGSTAFDLQASEKSVIEAQSLQEDHVPVTVNEGIESKSDILENTHLEIDQISRSEEHMNVEKAVYDDKDDEKDEKQHTPSDEEESSSEDENSESHSKDKSDAMGDKSDADRDDRSDVHNDDRSDHQNDGKSDITNDNEDEDKSDIHDNEQLYKQQDNNLFQDMEDITHDINQHDIQDKSEVNYENVTYAQDNLYVHKDLTHNQDESDSNIHEYVSSLEHEDLGIKCEENLECNITETTKNAYSEGNNTLDDVIQESTSEVLQNVSGDDNKNTKLEYQAYEEYGNADSKSALQCESTYTTENYESAHAKENYESKHATESYESTIQHLSEDAFENKESFLSSTESQNFGISDKDQYSSKICDDEDSNTFRADEVHFENSQRITDIRGSTPSHLEDENKALSLETNNDMQTSNFSEYVQEVPTDLKIIDNISTEEHENNSGENIVHLHEDIISQRMKNTTVTENPVMTEMEETQYYDNFSQCKESIQNSNATYSESTLTKNVISEEIQKEGNYLGSEKDNENETHFGYTDSRIESFTSSNTYEYSSRISNETISQANTFNQENFHYTDANESDFKSSDFTVSAKNTNDNFESSENLEHSQEKISHSGEYNVYASNETQIKSVSQHETLNDVTSVQYDPANTDVLSKDGFSSEVADINFNDKEICLDKSEMSGYAEVNGKDAAAFTLSSESTSEFYKTELLQQETVTDMAQQVEKDSSYLINNRFHSDSPEDNTMRSDSSPDVPYPADLPGKFSEVKTAFSVETTETYIQSTDDYKNNMNFSTDGLPISPKIHSLNSNQNNTYTESSEDESNSVVRGNVSPYAYTNKAYSREEEDIDGNHIYKEETTEVFKQVEFDGNNLQSVNTNQVSSVMNYSQEFQDTQYTSGTGSNYDFHLEEWGKPMGLPTPPDGSQKTVSKKAEKPLIKSKTSVDANGKAHSPSVSSKLSSPLKKPKPKTAKESSSTPIYVDLAYVPQHADPHYCDVEFFKKIRARYYVFSSVNPSKEVLNALLEAKKTWNEDLSVTIIPTYETDTLGYWMAQNRNDLAEYSIDISPSASRCTVNLQDHQTSCSAYRLEF